MTATVPLNDSFQIIRGRVLVVDDEVELTRALVEMLGKQGYETIGFNDGIQALEMLRDRTFDVLLVDLMMPGIDGLSLLRAALEIDPHLIAVLMTGQGTVQTAVEAMKSGAFDYILKPFKLNTILTSLSRALEVRQLRMENVQLRELLQIYELGREITSILDIEAILLKTAQAALRESQADEVSIMLPDPTDDQLVVVATSGENRAQLIGEKVPLEGTIAGWVARHQEMLTLQGEVTDPRFVVAYPRPEILQAISMPMSLGKSLMGVINVNLTRNPHPLTQGQVTGLGILANIAAAAVENARLYEQTEKRLRRISALRAIDLAITASLDLRVTLDILLDQVSGQLAVDAAAVLLLDRLSQNLEYAAGRGLNTDALKHSQTLLGEGYTGTAALERKTISIPDLNESDPDPFLERLKSAEGIQACVVTSLVAKGEVKGVLIIFHRQPVTPDEEWLEFFEALAGQAAIAINSAQLFDHLQRSNQQIGLAYQATIEGWSRALDLRDKETEGHTQRVTDMTMRLAQAMDFFDEEELIHIRRGALLHDIGKMGVPDEILLKPGDLTEEEEAIMRKHPENAHQLLSPIAYLRRAQDIPLYHHEYWDGTGYPHGLKGEQIPLAARIFSVVDVWDALRSDRPYRPGWPESKVLVYIKDRSGQQFDPQVVEAFLQMMQE